MARYPSYRFSRWYELVQRERSLIDEKREIGTDRKRKKDDGRCSMVETFCLWYKS